jgi:anti-anti-sigma regulatory factor
MTDRGVALLRLLDFPEPKVNVQVERWTEDQAGAYAACVVARIRCGPSTTEHLDFAFIFDDVSIRYVIVDFLHAASLSKWNGTVFKELHAIYDTLSARQGHLLLSNPPPSIASLIRTDPVLSALNLYPTEDAAREEVSKLLDPEVGVQWNRGPDVEVLTISFPKGTGPVTPSEIARGLTGKNVIVDFKDAPTLGNYASVVIQGLHSIYDTVNKRHGLMLFSGLSPSILQMLSSDPVLSTLGHYAAIVNAQQALYEGSAIRIRRFRKTGRPVIVFQRKRKKYRGVEVLEVAYNAKGTRPPQVDPFTLNDCLVVDFRRASTLGDYGAFIIGTLHRVYSAVREMDLQMVLSAMTPSVSTLIDADPILGSLERYSSLEKAVKKVFSGRPAIEIETEHVDGVAVVRLVVNPMGADNFDLSEVPHSITARKVLVDFGYANTFGKHSKVIVELVRALYQHLQDRRGYLVISRASPSVSKLLRADRTLATLNQYQTEQDGIEALREPPGKRSRGSGAAM